MLHLTIVYYYKYFTQKYIYMYIHCTCTCILKVCSVDRGFEPRSDYVCNSLMINANHTIYLLYLINFRREDDQSHFLLDQHSELYFYSASSLKQQSADRHFAPLGHIILIPSQPVFALTN
jgi:hypothetical protein